MFGIILAAVSAFCLRMGSKEYRKKVESLMRKGFEYGTIKKAVENLE